MNQELKQKIENVEEKMIDSAQELNKVILDESEKMSNALCQKSDELLAVIYNEVKNLNMASQADQRRLAGFFGELSKKLENNS
jgi:hypothetical protein